MRLVQEKQYCSMSKMDVGDAERRPRHVGIESEFVKCPECERILVPTSTGKFRQHQRRGDTTASLDQIREVLWHYAGRRKDKR